MVLRCGSLCSCQQSCVLTHIGLLREIVNDEIGYIETGKGSTKPIVNVKMDFIRHKIEKLYGFALSQTERQKKTGTLYDYLTEDEMYACSARVNSNIFSDWDRGCWEGCTAVGAGDASNAIRGCAVCGIKAVMSEAYLQCRPDDQPPNSGEYVCNWDILTALDSEMYLKGWFLKSMKEEVTPCLMCCHCCLCTCNVITPHIGISLPQVCYLKLRLSRLDNLSFRWHA